MNVNSMLHWYPKIKDVVPTPETVMIEFDIWKYMEDGFMKSPAWAAMLEPAKAAGRHLGYPLFLRTDHSSCKHDWSRTCFVPSEDVLPHHLHAVIDGNLEHDLLPSAIVLRKFLHLDAKFTAFHGMPVAREYRYFADCTGIHCVHPYWPIAAIRFYNSMPKDVETNEARFDWLEAHPHGQGPDGWEAMLDEISKPLDDMSIPNRLALEATAWCDEHWSVDICLDIDGKWWVTDMALGKDSYHFETCPNAQKPEMAHGLIRHRMGEMEADE